MNGPTPMSERPKAAPASDDEIAVEAAPAPVPGASALAAMVALVDGPKRRLVLVAGAGLLLFLGALTVVGVSLLRESPPAPVPAAPPAVAIRDEARAEPASKSGIEARFEAMQRDLSTRPPGRTAPEAANKAEIGNVAVPSAEAPRSASVELRAPVIVTPPPGAPAQVARPVAEGVASPAKPESRIADGCNVGGSDAKGSAEAILACIREFNALDGREPPRKRTPQVRPGT